MSSHNPCGDCNACCERFTIPDAKWYGEEGKPRDQLCDKWCNGCTIYEERPAPCRTFECLWLKINTTRGGTFPIELRPNKTNMLVTARIEDGEHVVLIDETEPDTVDIMNMTKAQSILVAELLHILQQQDMPVGLYLRKYNWDIHRINVEKENNNDDVQQDEERAISTE